ncbi:MAG: hypothetical protein PHO32_07915 [Candidatus Cloacimonetes bacterium]|nr:hypothetical protein [Candidatus Cloacimonadota bacterium]
MKRWKGGKVKQDLKIAALDMELYFGVLGGDLVKLGLKIVALDLELTIGVLGGEKEKHSVFI